MNRTRMIFYGLLVVCLALLAWSLAGQVISQARLLQIYVGCSVFALGVVLLDFFGILGHHGDTAGHDFAVGHDLGGHAAGADAMGHDLGGHDLGSHVGAEHAGADQPGDVSHGATAEGHAAVGHDAAAAHAGQAQHAEGQHATQNSHSSAAPLLSVLAYLRLLVYFCLGFGPVGWAALALRWSPAASLGLAAAVGIVTTIVARAFFRFQRHDTGAVAPESELVHEQAVVIVPLSDRTMGKVRVRSGMNVSDLYALAAEAGCEYADGDTVRIVRVGDECVFVR